VQIVRKTNNNLRKMPLVGRQKWHPVCT